MRILFNTIAKVLSLGITNFFDYFNLRSNTTGGLGTSSSGHDWEAVNGTINVNNGKAKATTIPTSGSSGSDYPISVIEMAQQNNIITLQDTTIGSGIALWVQSSSDWWMVSVDSAYNFIPGPINYTIGPSTFTGQSSFTSGTAYSVAAGVFTSAIIYSQGPITFSSIGPSFTSNVPSFTSDGPFYTSSQNFSTSIPYWSNQSFFSSPNTSTTTNYSPAPPVFTPSPFSSFVGPTVWSRQNSYTASAETYFSTINYVRPNVFWTAGPTTWTRTTVRTGPNTYSSSYTSSRTFTSGGPTSSARSYTSSQTFNLTQFFTSNNPTYTQRFFSVDDGFQSSRFSQSGVAYTPGPTSWTSNIEYTGSAIGYSSARNFTSAVPYTSAINYSNITQYTAGAQYTAQDTWFSLITYTGSSTYTSAISYSSAQDPGTFSYAAILRISQSASNIVSEISSAIVSTAQTIKSIIVQASENTITARAFSDTGALTQLGSDLIHTATGAIINTRYGISLSKAEYSNDEIAASIQIESE